MEGTLWVFNPLLAFYLWVFNPLLHILVVVPVIPVLLSKTYTRIWEPCPAHLTRLLFLCSSFGLTFVSLSPMLLFQTYTPCFNANVPVSVLLFLIFFWNPGLLFFRSCLSGWPSLLKALLLSWSLPLKTITLPLRRLSMYYYSVYNSVAPNYQTDIPWYL